MGPGDSVRKIFENQQLRLQGAPLTIYKQWGTKEMTELSSVAIRQGDRFQFAANTDIERGDVIQLENAKSFFRVDDVDEIPQFNVIHHLDVRVTKIDELGKEIRISTAGHAVFNAPVTGGVQIGGSGNTQNVNITTNPDLNNSLEGLLKLIHQSSMDELDKEDYEAAVKRIGELADKPKSEGALKRMKEKFDFIDSAVKMGKLGADALPYLTMIGTALGLS